MTMEDNASSPVEISNVRRILSFDGGGVRGLASLIILRGIMDNIHEEQIKHGAKNTTPPRPCQFFDLICGTSTGGLIAIMLGRLGMTVQECIDAYVSVSDRVFSMDKVVWEKIPTGENECRFNYQTLKDVVQEMIEKQVGSKEHVMSAPTAKPSCKTFVVAKLAGAPAGPPKLFRSYSIPGQPASKCKIWQAARATTAAPTFFKAMTIEEPPPGLTFVDGGMGHNNPAQLAREEIAAIWPGCQPFIVSIGTGKPKLHQIPHHSSVDGDVEVQRTWFTYVKKFIPVIEKWEPKWQKVTKFPAGVVSILKMASAMPDFATDSEGVHRQLHKASRHGNDKFTYFRFNVDREIGDIGLGDHTKIKDMSFLATAYLEDPEIGDQVILCTQYMMTYHASVVPAQDEVPIDSGAADAVDPEQEVEALVEQLKKNPSDNRLIKQLADAYLKISNIDKVILGWADLVEQHPDAWKLQTQLAKALRRRATMHKVFSRRASEENKRDFAESEIDIWLHLVNKHPKEWSLQVQLKKAFSKKGDIDEEIRGWHTLVSKNPKDWKLQSDLAQAYAKKDDKVMTDKTLGTMDQEIVGWRNLVKQWPDEWGLAVRLAEAYTKKTRMEEAIRNWISAMQRSREKKAYSLLATAVKRRKDTNREIKDWAGLVDAHPGSRGLQMQLEMAYAKRQDPAIAIDGWKELVANHPAQQELSIHLQRAYERREPTPQNLNVEIEGWKQLIKRWPRVLTLQGHLAEVFLRFDDDSGEEIAHWIDLLNEFPQEQEFRDRVLHACLLCDSIAEAWGYLDGLDRTCPQNEEIPEVLREMFAN